MAADARRERYRPRQLHQGRVAVDDGTEIRPHHQHIERGGAQTLDRPSAYCASKHALTGLSKVLAMELRPHGIAVHAICPGGVDTQLSRDAMPHRDKTNWLTPDDIAHAALYLATLSARAATDEFWFAVSTAFPSADRVRHAFS